MINRASILVVFIMLLSGCSAKPEPVPFSVSQADLLLERGVQLHARGDYHDALFFFSRAANEYRSLDQRARLQQAHQNLAETAFLVAQYDLALQAAKEAKSMAVALQLPAREQRARLALARALNAFGADDNDYWSRASEELTPLLSPLGSVNAALRKPAQQWSSLERSAVLLQAHIEVQQGTSHGPWLARANQAALREAHPTYHARLLRLEAQADPTQRLDKLNEALDIYTKEGFRPGIAASLEAIAADFADAAHQQDGTAQALSYFERALYVRVWLNDAYHIQLNLAALQELHQQLGNAEQAEHYQTLLQRLSTNPAVAQEMRRAM